MHRRHEFCKTHFFHFFVPCLWGLLALAVGACTSSSGGGGEGNANGGGETPAVAAGTPDATFGTDGVLIFNNGSGDIGNALVIDSLDRMVVTGTSNATSHFGQVTLRVTAEGALDTAGFAAPDGFYTPALGGYSDGRAVALDGSGNILVGGQSDELTGNYDYLLWRYTSAGALDTGFQSTGYATAAIAGPQTVRAVLVVGSRYLIAGTDNGTPTIWGFDTDGNVDTTFGTSGTTTFGGYSLTDMVADGSGNLFVTGTSIGGGFETSVWKTDADGMVDTNFGTSGKAIGGEGWGYAIELDSDGNLIVGGYYGGGTDDEAAVWRFSPAGVLDATFGTDGMATFDFGPSDDVGRGMAIDAAGNILVTGDGFGVSDNEMFLVRFTPEGQVDTTFAEGAGYVSYAEGGYSIGNRGTGVAVDGQGRIVVTGGHGNGSDDDLAVWRFE